MHNPLYTLTKQASFDLKSSKMRCRRRRPPHPLIVRGISPSALATHYFVSNFRSQFPFRAPPLLNSWIRHCMIDNSTDVTLERKQGLTSDFNMLQLNDTVIRGLSKIY